MAVVVDPRLGSELLGYRIDTLLGRGGTGVVYRAYDPRLKRNVALELLAPEVSADERFRQRFLAETELAAALEHPNVVPIHDAGEVDGQLWPGDPPPSRTAPACRPGAAPPWART